MFETSKKVSFNIASEASYVYIMSGQKLIKKAKNSKFWRVFRNLKLPRNSVTRQANLLIGQKLVKKAKIEKIRLTLWKKPHNGEKGECM